MKKLHLIVTFLLLGQLSACSNEKTNSFCDNHADIHQQHKDIVTVVNIVYSENGELAAALEVSKKEATKAALSDTSSIVRITAQATCKPLPTKVVNINNRWQAEYKLECGSDNKLELVSIEILNNFPDIQEVEVHIKTPATDKNFVLNRQCERPIFVL